MVLTVRLGRLLVLLLRVGFGSRLNGGRNRNGNPLVRFGLRFGLLLGFGSGLVRLRLLSRLVVLFRRIARLKLSLLRCCVPLGSTLRKFGRRRNGVAFLVRLLMLVALVCSTLKLRRLLGKRLVGMTRFRY